MRKTWNNSIAPTNTTTAHHVFAFLSYHNPDCISPFHCPCRPIRLLYSHTLDNLIVFNFTITVRLTCKFEACSAAHGVQPGRFLRRSGAHIREEPIRWEVPGRITLGFALQVATGPISAPFRGKAGCQCFWVHSQRKGFGGYVWRWDARKEPRFCTLFGNY